MAYRLVDPESVVDWQFDWSDWLADGDSILTHQWSITPLHGTSPETPTLTNETQASVTGAGLQAGKIYHLTDHITTAAGLEADRSIILRCDHR